MKKIIFLVTMVFISCSFESNLQKEMLHFYFPLQEEGWSYTFKYFENGIVEEKVDVKMKTSKKFVVAKGRIFPIFCEMQSVTFPSQKITKGFVYPLSNSLSEIDGFLAEIILIALSNNFCDFETAKRNIQFFNWPYLKEKVQEVENLEKLHKNDIAEAIACGKFSVKLLR